MTDESDKGMGDGRMRVCSARIVVIDDHPLIREGLSGIIGDHADLELCGAAAGVKDGLDLVNEQQPDVAIVDIGLQDGDGLDLTRRILALSPNSRVLISSVFNETVFAEQALAAGARGFITKSSRLEELIEAIRSVLRGEVYVSPEMRERLNGTKTPDAVPGANPLGRLSLRELQVFKLIGEGKSTAAIAELLDLSVKTVETHRAHIKQKLHLKRPHDLKEYAIRWALSARD